MNWVDLAIIILLLLFIIEAIGKSFLSQTLDFLAFLAAFFLSLRFYNLAAQIFEDLFQIPHSLTNVIGFVVVWFLVESILFSLIHLFFFKLRPRTFTNRYLNLVSFIPAFLKGLVFVAIVLVMVGTFPIQPRIKVAVEQSQIGSQILSKTHQLETPLKNIFGGISQETLTFLTIKPQATETVDLGFKNNNFSFNSSLEGEMITMVNNERQKKGLSLLKGDASLTELGRVHSADMFKRGYFSHFSPEGENVANRAQKQGITYLVIGENLAYAPNLNLAHDGLMNSAGHRANILSSDYGRVGIGIADSEVYGLMITQVFAN